MVPGPRVRRLSVQVQSSKHKSNDLPLEQAVRLDSEALPGYSLGSLTVGLINGRVRVVQVLVTPARLVTS